jgi:hypothetical protein
MCTVNTMPTFPSVGCRPQVMALRPRFRRGIGVEAGPQRVRISREAPSIDPHSVNTRCAASPHSHD